jgi:SAM-dependent methyltransferase
MMNGLVAHLPSRRPLHLVEVGCGQGTFLSQLAAGQGNRFASLTGFDPAWRARDKAGDRVKIHACYFGSETVGLVPGRADIIVSRHTIEHIPDPIGFLRTIRGTMEAGVDARLFLETPDIRWIVETFQPQDLFYEHCSIFSENAFRMALAASGFAPVNIDRVFGDQYFWVESRPASDGIRVPAECDFAPTARTFTARRDRFVQRWRERINEFSADGPVWLWGAASKGVTFALLVDPDASGLAGAIDLNLNKVGRFMAMTGLRIESPEALPDGAIVIVMNPNYHSEISARIDAMGKTARLHCIDDV